MAAAQGVTMPRLLVERPFARGAETSAERRNAIEQVFRVERPLPKIANNVNQIAKATNATLRTQPETFATLGAVRRVAERIEEAVDEPALQEPLIRCGAILQGGQRAGSPWASYTSRKGSDAAWAAGWDRAGRGRAVPQAGTYGSG